MAYIQSINIFVTPLGYVPCLLHYNGIMVIIIDDDRNCTLVTEFIKSRKKIVHIDNIVSKSIYLYQLVHKYYDLLLSECTLIRTYVTIFYLQHL